MSHMLSSYRMEFLSQFLVPAHPLEDDGCPVCHEEYNNTDHTPVTFSGRQNCRHIFGRPCIEAWLSMAHVNSCPMCRRKLYPLIYDQVEEVQIPPPFLYDMLHHHGELLEAPVEYGESHEAHFEYDESDEALDEHDEYYFVDGDEGADYDDDDEEGSQYSASSDLSEYWAVQARPLPDDFFGSFDSIAFYFFDDDDEIDDFDYELNVPDTRWLEHEGPYCAVSDEEIIALLKRVWAEIELGCESFHLDSLFEPPPTGAGRNRHVRRMFLDMLPEVDEGELGPWRKDALDNALRAMVRAVERGGRSFEDMGERRHARWVKWIKNGLDIARPSFVGGI
ncbi:hypothetical protein IQ07DRAFT_595078 [Pyrenochaeta sp. DS3sAY3a]|nr:hypothetical protein IQ07DRAFT_595078 [Pyrenochaeta sp. DS3sAY3a]